MPQASVNRGVPAMEHTASTNSSVLRMWQASPRPERSFNTPVLLSPGALTPGMNAGCTGGQVLAPLWTAKVHACLLVPSYV